jgi:hypothetical protein
MGVFTCLIWNFSVIYNIKGGIHPNFGESFGGLQLNARLIFGISRLFDPVATLLQENYSVSSA